MDQPIQTASLEIITAPMNAGEPRTFYLSGQYFELIDAVDPVDVVLSDSYGSQRGLMRQAEASFYLKATAFKVVQITSATNQTIRFGYGSGEGGTRRAAGSVNIANAPSLSAATINALIRPELPSGNWSNNGALVANTPVTIFAPGANLNGAILWHVGGFDELTSIGHQAFVAKATAPAGPLDGDVLSLAFYTCYLSGTSGRVAHNMPQPQRIAAGLGLYYVSNVAGNAVGTRHARYTLL